MLKKIEKSEFESICKIRFKNVLQAFDKYNYEIKSCETIATYYQVIEELYIKNGVYAIIDFYCERLKKENFNELISKVPDEYKDELQKFEIFIETDSTYFIIKSEKLLKALTYINYNELFFVNFYFERLEITVWPNFNNELMIFREK